METSATRAFLNDSIFMLGARATPVIVSELARGRVKMMQIGDTLDSPANDKAFFFDEVRRFADSDRVFFTELLRPFTPVKKFRDIAVSALSIECEFENFI